MTESASDLFLHSHAFWESQNLGKGTRVCSFTHILPYARLGQDCNICDQVFIDNVIIGDRETIKYGVQIWHGVEIEDEVFSQNVTFTNDRFPRSKVYQDTFLNAIIRKGASLGANATILRGVTADSNAMVGAGAVVTRSVSPNAMVVGNPAKTIGYVNAQPSCASNVIVSPKAHTVSGCSVPLFSRRRIADVCIPLL
ncbi:acyltransferase [Pseudomonas sp. Ant30-3]|uniref:acyltransferase n=1 Tax=Pseudomonas sp. Ant30-3 TaxID=1488328 RepID=UPI001F158CD1|nr:acyltransferase [Pseudomonas sp. Ant30-3]